jgi:hypothetical protein
MSGVINPEMNDSPSVEPEAVVSAISTDDSSAALAAQWSTVKGRQLIAFKIVQFGTLLALVWKLPFFIACAVTYFSVPLHQTFFPAFFSATLVVIAAYLVAVVGLGYLWLTESDTGRRQIAWVVVGVLTILIVHQGTYNDMTFTTAWWAAVWSAWFAGRIDENDSGLIDRGARLSRTILSVILLGGAVGKWTAEYWSGQVLYEIYFVDRDFWIYNLIRSSLEPETVRQVATWYSRKVIIVETVCGFGLWILPPRIAATVGVLVFASIALSSNIYLFSVVLSLIALATVGWLVPQRQGKKGNEVTQASVGLG